jgi:hypothetical protein
MVNFSNQHPNDIITRALVLQELKTIPPHLILELPVEFHKFVTGTHSTITDSKGNSTSTLKYDWEYALFEATNTKLLKLINSFQKVDKTQGHEETPEPGLN